MNDFEMGQQSGMESAIDTALQDMRKDCEAFREYIGKWNAQKRTDWLAVKKANDTGFDLWISTTTAGRMITLLKDRLTTRSFEKELEEIRDIYDELSSWDLYTDFGWKYERAHK